jgi:hypothetical protein
MRRAALPILLAIILVSGLGCYISAPMALQGSGVSKTETRELPTLTGKVEVQGAFRATIRPGDKGSVQLSGDDNILPLVETDVTDGSLVIRIKDDTAIRPNVTLKADITLPKLTSLTASGATIVRATAGECERFEAHASGASRVTVEGIKSEKVAFTLDGASDLTADGATSDLKVESNGASQIHAAKLSADSADVNLSGASRAEVAAAKSVRGDASGASNLEVVGDPATRAVNTSGVSNVKFQTKPKPEG